ncbi:MAG: hypothetical protein FJ404_07880 [Verrucomicrobia bacterium]|nr:hypothetical protein [Verrucomicrobiota bacterium]
MKLLRLLIILAVGLLGGVLGWSAGSVATGLPSILDIEVVGKEVVVRVEVPAGVKRVTIEGRTRAEGGAWQPKAVVRTEHSSVVNVVQLKFPLSESVELLRARVDTEEIVPASWQRGTNQFGGPSSSAPMTGVVPGMAEDALGAPKANRTTGGDKSARAVVESDIWQVRGDRVYFFNQYRGLQIIDVADPDQPKLEGTLSMAMAGEQMYVLEGGPVVLLARENCHQASWDQVGSAAVVVKTLGQPEVLASVPLEGSIVESRMVGSVLYVASQRYREIRKPVPVPPGSTLESPSHWEWGTQLVSVDLADPLNPRKRSEFWTPGYQTVVYATDRFFLLSNMDPRASWRSVIQVVDISNPDGTMKTWSEIRPLGQLLDKFKLHIDGDVLALVVERWDSELRNTAGGWGRLATRVETYSIADPAQPVKLGHLETGFGERLFATRFDGKRLYAVTFLRIDPLWVIDLTNPAKPVIHGELEIPGWSSYIHPMGDRLVSVGVETNRVAVSLFDVADPAKPSMLSRVRLGENYSWSEANHDEKAFSVFEDEGLIMLPYQGNTSNGYASRVQLIDLSRTALVQRGVIEHTFQPRRTQLRNGRVLSISGEALLVVDAANRDVPKVTARLELAWPADRIFKIGSHLLSVADGGSWLGASVPGVRVSTTSAKDQTLAKLDLDAALGSILGASLSGPRLVLLQGVSSEVKWKPTPEGPWVPESTNAASLTMTVVDVSALPLVKVLGSTTRTERGEEYWGTFEAHWLENGTLVWSDRSYPYWAWARLAVVDAAFIGRGGPWWGGGGGSRLIASQINGAGLPQWVSMTRVNETQSWWNYSQAFASGTKVYLSHQSSEFVPNVLPKGQEMPKPVMTLDERGNEVLITPPMGTWITRYFLDVVDFADPAIPTVRKPVNIPGELRGLSHQGEVIYTAAPVWDPVTLTTDWKEYIQASAYDGVSARLIDAVPLPESWPRESRVQEGRVLISKPGDKASSAKIEVWKLGGAGKFELRSVANLSGNADGLALGSDWIGVLQGGGKLEFFRWQPADALVKVGTGIFSSCTWLDMTKLAGSPEEGFWVPNGAYGIGTIAVKP